MRQFLFARVVPSKLGALEEIIRRSRYNFNPPHCWGVHSTLSGLAQSFTDKWKRWKKVMMGSERCGNSAGPVTTHRIVGQFETSVNRKGSTSSCNLYWTCGTHGHKILQSPLADGAVKGRDCMNPEETTEKNGHRVIGQNAPQIATPHKKQLLQLVLSFMLFWLC